MVRILAIALALTAVLSTGWQTSQSCSTFVLRDGGRLVFGKNFDYDIGGGGVVFVNKRNVSKVAATFETPARWTSKYGSVTFNLYGREMPMGGMNEAGLVVENMWLDESEYAPNDSTPTVNNMQWIQCQLDQFATVSEVVEKASSVRVSNYGASKVHYLISDANGDCAALEFIGGRVVIHHGDRLPVAAMTNVNYQSCLDFLARFDGDETSDEYMAVGKSRGRFVMIANALQDYKGGSADAAVDYAFGLLKKVGSEEYTRWSIVYDIGSRRIHFLTQDNGSRRTIDLAGFDFSCQEPVLLHDMNDAVSGNLGGKFEEYTFEKNRDLIVRMFTATEFLKDTPMNVLELLAKYPDMLECAE